MVLPATSLKASRSKSFCSAVIRLQDLCLAFSYSSFNQAGNSPCYSGSVSLGAQKRVDQIGHSIETRGLVECALAPGSLVVSFSRTPRNLLAQTLNDRSCPDARKSPMLDAWIRSMHAHGRNHGFQCQGGARPGHQDSAALARRRGADWSRLAWRHAMTARNCLPQRCIGSRSMDRASDRRIETRSAPAASCEFVASPAAQPLCSTHSALST